MYPIISDSYSNIQIFTWFETQPFISQFLTDAGSGVEIHQRKNHRGHGGEKLFSWGPAEESSSGPHRRGIVEPSVGLQFWPDLDLKIKIWKSGSICHH